MANPELVVNALEFVGDYVLRLTFEDGNVKDFDCQELLNEPIYSSLRDMSFFTKRRHCTAQSDGMTKSILLRNIFMNSGSSVGLSELGDLEILSIVSHVIILPF